MRPLFEVDPGSERSASNKTLEPVLNDVLRANVKFELVQIDDLSSDQRATLGDLTNAPHLHGILRPREASGWTIKIVDQATARLYSALLRSGPLPGGSVIALGEVSQSRLIELVLEGVLEIGSVRGFVSGAAAFRTVGRADPPIGDNILGRLSVVALQNAQELSICEPTRLAAWLYNFNRIPLNVRWRRELPSVQVTSDFLGLGRNEFLDRSLRRTWTLAPSKSQDNAWWKWQSQRKPLNVDVRLPTYKLYVSPLPVHLSEVFPIIVATFESLEVPCFKVGWDAAGLLRPDKLVAYFDDLEGVQSAAQALLPRINDCPSQGVPFTAQIGNSGLLSWGLDPPSALYMLKRQRPESWRWWVVQRLAAALLAAGLTSAEDVLPWQFALDRVGSLGVEIASWTPPRDAWTTDVFDL